MKDIDPGTESSHVRPLGGAGAGAEQGGPLAGTYLFTADDGTHGRELWKTDGTATGTVLVKDINPGPEGSRG